MLSKLKFRFSGRALAVVSVSLGSLAIALGVAALLSTWVTIDWGTAPAWLSAVFSALTLAGVWVAYVNLRTTQEQRRDDQASPARLLVIEHMTASYTTGTKVTFPALVVTLRNASTNTAFTDVNVRGATLDGIGCQQTFEDYWSEGTQDEFRFLAPNSTLKSRWIVPIPNRVIEHGGNAQVQYEYTDGNGRRWRRLGKMEPQRIHSAEFDLERLERFEKAMKARPNEGARRVSVDVNIAVKSAFAEQAD